jgi:UDPglucose 6-dehydrogenase
MDKFIRPALENSSGKKISSGDIGLCYNPEFIALGSVINNMLNPDITLIGESDLKAGDLLEAIHTKVSLNKPEIHRLNFVNAELTKISINTYVTTKISYANMLAELCDNLPNADVNSVTNAVGGDSRIGRKYLAGSIGYAGPCFPRDNKAFTALGKQIGVDCNIAEATDIINNRQIDRMFEQITDLPRKIENITVLGLSYKIDTGETDESQGIAICDKLNDADYHVKAFDPIAKTKKLSSGIKLSDTLEQSIENTDLVLIVTPWPDFINVLDMMRDGTTLIDPWRMCETLVASKNIYYVPMGKSLL